MRKFDDIWANKARTMTTSIHDNNSNISAVDISYFNYPTTDLLKMLSTSVEQGITVFRNNAYS